MISFSHEGFNHVDSTIKEMTAKLQKKTWNSKKDKKITSDAAKKSKDKALLKKGKDQTSIQVL